jgi:histidine triad (HIT) family protein
MDSANTLAAADLIQKLQELTQGMYYISESEYPLEVVHYEQPASGPLIPDSLRQLTVQPASAKVEVQELGYFFQSMLQDSPEPGAVPDSTAQRFRELKTFLEQQLKDIQVFRIGKREMQAYILGKTSDGHVAGLKTTVVET